MMLRRSSLVIALGLLAACGDDGGGGMDAGDDAGTDAGPRDAGTDARRDAGPGDAGLPPPPADWSCIGDVGLPVPTMPMAAIRFIVVDFASGDPIEGARVRGCFRDDPTCTMPVADVTSDAMGVGMGTIPLGTDGYFGFVEASADGFLPTLGYLSVPITMDYDEEAPLLRRGTVELLALAADIDADLDANGAVAVAVYDCADRFASGVRVDETTGAGDQFYLRGDVPDTTATETDVRGIAGYFNMPPGPHTFTATRAMDATQVSAIEITVRAGHLHLAVMLMTPDGQLYEPPP